MQKASGALITIGGLLLFAAGIIRTDRNDSAPAAALIIIGPIAILWGACFWLMGQSSRPQ